MLEKMWNIFNTHIHTETQTTLNKNEQTYLPL